MKTDLATVDVVDLQVLGVPVYRHVAAEEVGQIFQYIVVDWRIDVTLIVVLSEDKVGNPFFIVRIVHVRCPGSLIEGPVVEHLSVYQIWPY
jgi:hypothetical protein